MSGSDFEIATIMCYDSDGNELTDYDAAPSSLMVHDVPRGEDISCVVEGADGISSGTFDVVIDCSSDAPTKAPTTTATPTSSPPTPAPTHPGELICGSTTSGDYNGEPMEIEVRMPYAGDMTVDAGGSDFEIGAITCYDSDGNELRDADASPDSLMVHDVPGEDITCVVEGAAFAPSGTFDIVIECSSDAPTKFSTTTTPAPTHPGELICGSHTSGAYNGEPMEIEVRMPYAGDMTVDAAGSDFEISAITCYD